MTLIVEQQNRRSSRRRSRSIAWRLIAIAVAIVFIGLVLLLLFFAAVRIVNQYERLLIFTLGRTSPKEVKGPGWVFVVPIAQRGIRVDLREQFIEVPSQTGITKDNAPISIDFLIYWRIVDPYKSVVEVQDFNGALQNIATTTLRAVVGDILLDDVLSKREQINEILRVKLDEVTERWGGKVTTVEIREITPPRDVQDAMNRQLSAERTRRAVITESEGSRQSAINVAEGTKQAEILRAEGDRQAAILRAEGFALALERIYSAASQVDQKTMALQYLEAFKALGESPSTKYIIPLEITQLADSFRGLPRGRQRAAAAADRKRCDRPRRQCPAAAGRARRDLAAKSSRTYEVAPKSAKRSPFGRNPVGGPGLACEMRSHRWLLDSDPGDGTSAGLPEGDPAGRRAGGRPRADKPDFRRSTRICHDDTSYQSATNGSRLRRAADGPSGARPEDL